MRKMKVIDLFAGAGGLSLGFQQTGKYDIKVAFENSPYMQETYKKNHSGVDVRGDVCAADYKEIHEKYGPIDVVIGGPPCQGFSNANRQKNHAISQNNMLVKEYIRAVLELKPKAFVMENVSTLQSDVHRFYLSKGDKRLIRRYSIPTKRVTLCLIEKDYAFRGAEAIVRDKNRVLYYLWPETHYSALNIIFKSSKNSKKMHSALSKYKKKLLLFAEDHLSATAKDHVLQADAVAFQTVCDYYSGKKGAKDIKEAIAPAIMIQRMLSIAKEIYDNHIIVSNFTSKNGLYANIESFAVFDYLTAVLGEESGYTIKNDVLCAADYGAPQKRMRFVVLGVRKDVADSVDFPKAVFDETSYRTVRDAIEDLETVEPFYDMEDDKTGIILGNAEKASALCAALRDSDTLKNHIATKTTETALERFRALKQGENFHSLDNKLKTNTYTDASRTQNTIYLRLRYDEPSGTVVNVRKSMWIHPVLDRAISIREAARLQTFPDSFVFYGSKDKQYQQVGNAVPPIMAKAIAEELAKTISEAVSSGDQNAR
ncbi:MAG: DNA cytosine methyltransferase [Clostridia bacterium]|nr:DNA cytosine methyltransferase [Clostridia bacterium]